MRSSIVSRYALAFLLVPSLACTQAGKRDRPQKGDAADSPSTSAVPSKAQNDAPVASGRLTKPVLWHKPDDIAGLDLLLGQGGQKHSPKPPFTFDSEATGGTNPKFDVKDANGTSWRCKLGDESQPEVVASRLLWAVGFYVNDDYLLPTAQVENLQLKRGKNLVRDKTIENVRFARKPGGQKKIGIWEWKTNPFYGSREFNGLRVMMAVINNWDLKDVNNSVYQDSKSGEQIFLVNDVGATFGSNGLGFSKARSKGNIDSFKGSQFVQRVNGDTVDFATPHAPTKVLWMTGGATAKQYHYRSGLDWIGNDIPVKDARWMGSMLGQLSHQQLVDAFRAGNFPAEAIDDYVSVVESRIQELKRL